MAATAIRTLVEVATILKYHYTPIDDELVNQYAYSPPEGAPKDNSSLDTKPVIVYDARGREAKFSTNTSGSQLLKHVSAEKEFDDERIKGVCLKEVEELLKDYTLKCLLRVCVRVVVLTPLQKWCSVSGSTHGLQCSFRK